MFDYFDVQKHDLGKLWYIYLSSRKQTNKLLSSMTRQAKTRQKIPNYTQTEQGRIQGSISRGLVGRSGKPRKVTLLRMDGGTDRQTNKVAYRVVCPRLKIFPTGGNLLEKKFSPVGRKKRKRRKVEERRVRGKKREDRVNFQYF